MKSKLTTMQLMLYSFFIPACLVLSSGAGILLVFYYKVYFGDDSYLRRENIISRMQEETQILFEDSTTSIGSFFDEDHRKYIPFDQIPKHMIDAIIASEDKNFYTHSGIDMEAIFRAAFNILRSGRIMGGGSTITQQTVKNVLNRWENTFKRKFNEAIAAKQLEKLYTKNEIMEFYLNQFHVTANGSGLGIAAKYYFDKETKDLDLVEGAFIAGSVKGPAKYNPFIKVTKEQREIARANAKYRKNYVLKRMLEENLITTEEYEAALPLEVPFHQGEFRSQQVILAEYIRKFLDKKEILEALDLENIDEIDSTGLRIITTLDYDMQHFAQLAARRNLSRLQTILKGFKTYPSNQFKPLKKIEAQQFYFGKVTEIDRNTKNPHIKVTFGHTDGFIDAEALMRYAKLLDLPSGLGYENHLSTLLKGIKVDDILFTEVKNFDAENNAILELQSLPEVNGGLIVLDKGEIKSIVGGFNTDGYNRAIDGQRLAGSTFKALVYYAALQLGWSTMDRLDNERQLFPFQKQFYFPRPDHISPYKDVSMMWAGIMSENVGSVNLTYRLLEKINYDQFKQVLRLLNLERLPGEDINAYYFRLAKETGVTVESEGVREQQLRNAVQTLRPDLIFDGRLDLFKKLNKMWYGSNYQGEIYRVVKRSIDKVFTLREKATQARLIKNNFIRMGLVAKDLGEDWQNISQIIAAGGPEAALKDPDIQNLLRRFRVISGQGSHPELAYYRVYSGEDGNYASAEEFYQDFNPLAGRAINPQDIEFIWGEDSEITINKVLIEGFLPVGVYAKLKNKVDFLTDQVFAKSKTSDLWQHFNHHDFRVVIGLKYLIYLAKSAGITSKLEPVLSFPLGTNAVSTSEVAKMYQTMLSGVAYQFYKDGPSNQMNIIKRIESREGKILFEPKPIVRQIVAPELSYQMREILRRVVTHGTGRRAQQELHFTLPGGDDGKQITVPAFGKTGTTNDYTTSYFSGFLPYPTGVHQKLRASDSYTIAAYVGFDLNRSMQRGRYKVSGAFGALPWWADLGKFIIEYKKYGDFLKEADPSLYAGNMWALEPPPNSRRLNIDLVQGIIYDESGATDDAGIITNIEKTGERFENEFQADTHMASVYMPRGRESNDQSVYRVFSPVIVSPDDQEDPSLQQINNVPSLVPMPASSPDDQSLKPSEDKFKTANPPLPVPNLKNEGERRGEGKPGREPVYPTPKSEPELGEQQDSSVAKTSTDGNTYNDNSSSQNDASAGVSVSEPNSGYEVPAAVKASDERDYQTPDDVWH